MLKASNLYFPPNIDSQAPSEVESGSNHFTFLTAETRDADLQAQLRDPRTPEADSKSRNPGTIRDSGK